MERLAVPVQLKARADFGREPLVALPLGACDGLTGRADGVGKPTGLRVACAENVQGAGRLVMRKFAEPGGEFHGPRAVPQGGGRRG